MDFGGFLMSRAITQIFVTQVLVNFQFSIFNLYLLFSIDNAGDWL